MPKNWYYKLWPTRNVAKKCKSMSGVHGVNLGLFCNGTYGLNIVNISRKYNIDIFGIYLSRKFLVDMFFEEMKLVKFAKKMANKMAIGTREKFEKVVCEKGLEKQVSEIKNKEIVSKLIKTKDFISNKVEMGMQVKSFLDEMLSGNIGDVLIENRIKRVLKKDRKTKSGIKKIMRLDDPWIYFSVFDMLKDSFNLSIDYCPEKYSNLSDFFKKIKNIKRICDVQVSFDTTKIKSQKLELGIANFFNELEKEYQELSCNVMVMNYLTGIDKKNRETMLKRFANHIELKNVENPLIIIKFNKNKFYEAEPMFDVFLMKLADIFKNKK